MAATGEEICRQGVFQHVATLFQQGHVTGQGGGVAGNVDDAPGGESGQGFDGVGVEALPGRIHHHHVGLDALLFQSQSRLAGVAAEKFGVFNAVALGVVLCVLHSLGDHLHADDLAGGGSHSQGDGAHAAVQIQNGVVSGDLCLGDGGLIEPLGLMVVHLIEGPGAQTEIQAAESVLDVAGAVEGDEFIAQHRVALPGVDGEHQGGEAGDLLQPAHQLVGLGNGTAIDHQTHQNLAGYSTPADVNVPQEALVLHFIVGGDAELVYIIHDRVLDAVRFLRQDQAALVFHNLMGAGLEETGVSPALLCRHGVLGLVAVAIAAGGGEDLHLF